MNYLRSELYGLSRTKALFAIAITWFVGFIFVTNFFLGAPVVSNPRQSYFTGMITIGAMSGFFLVLLINNFLTGKKLNTLKQTISFGVSRNTIYIVKFTLTLAVFVIITSILVIAGFIFGNHYLTGSNDQQIIKIINVYPLLISSVALCNWLSFSKINPILSTVTVLGVYLMSSDIVQLFDRIIFKRDILTDNFPSALILKAVNATHFESETFFVGIGLTVLFLIIGLKSFNRRDVV